MEAKLFGAFKKKLPFLFIQEKKMYTLLNQFFFLYRIKYIIYIIISTVERDNKITTIRIGTVLLNNIQTMIITIIYSLSVN